MAFTAKLDMQAETVIFEEIKLQLTAAVEVLLPGNRLARHKNVLKYPTALARRLPAELSVSVIPPPQLCCALKRFGGLDRKWRRDFNRKHTVATRGRNRIPYTTKCSVNWGGVGWWCSENRT